MYFIEKSNP